MLSLGLFRHRKTVREARRVRFQKAMRFEQLENRYLMTDSDDTLSEAFLLGALSTTAKTVSASVSPDTDVNMVGFDVTAGQVVDFDIDTPNNGPNGLATYIRLFNGQGVQIASNNDGAAPGENVVGFDSYLRFTFPTSGTYYLGTSNYNNIQYNPVTGDGDTSGGLYSVGSYVLSVVALPIDLNDSLTEATALGAITTTVNTVDASLVTDIDVNIVSFTVVSGQIVDFDIDTPNNGPAGLGSYIRLFNAQGTQLSFNNDAVAPGENVLGFDSYLRYTFDTAGMYFLGVSNFNNVQYDPLTGNGDTAGGRYSIGSYQLLVQTATIVVPDPNDSISEAIGLGNITTTPISVNSSLTTDIDVNMVGFTVGAGQVVDFDIDTPLNGIGGLGSYIRLFDVQGAQLAFNNDGLAPGETAIGFDAYLRYTFVAAGTFYLGVSNYNNIQYNAITGDGDTAGGVNTVGSYQLTIQALPNDTDDSISEATQLGNVSTTLISVNRSLVTDIDVNMVGFSVTTGQIVDFDIDTPLNGPGGLGSYLRLFNSQGQQLAFNNDAAAPGESVLGYDAYLRYTFITGGIFYLGVSNFNNILYDPITGNGDSGGGLNSIGSYQLLIQTAPVVVPDSNDTISEAVPLGAISTTPLAVSTTIAPDTDVNMVGFSVTAGQVVDFNINTALNGPGGLGSYIRLFDSAGTQLAFNNDGIAPGETRIGFDAYLRYTFATAGTYYLGVSNLNNIQYNPVTGDGDVAGGQNTIGAYTLIVQGLPIDTNDTIAEALSLGPVSSNAITVNASIVTDIDVNIVSFFVTAGQVVDFDIDTVLNGLGGLGSFIRLFNSQGLQLSFNNDAAAPGETVVGYDAYLRYTFASGGTYYLGVSNVNSEQYDPITGNGDAAGGFHSIGAYQLILQAAGAVVEDSNDAISEAALLGAISTTPITVSSSISPDTDVNMVGFTVSAGQIVDFDIDTTLNGAGGLGSYVRLFNSQGAQLGFNNDGAAPGESTIGFDAYLRYTFATAGTYYLGVSNSNNVLYDPVTGNGDAAGGVNAIGSYQLVVQTAPTVVNDPNDAISEAAALGSISTAAITVNANISPDTDVNMVGFTVTAGQVVDFDIDTTLNGAGGLGSYIRLFNAQGAQLAFNNDGIAPGETTLGIDAYLRFTFSTAGTYYLSVSNSNNVLFDPVTGNGDAAGGSNATGNYQLIVQTAPAIVTDPNDAISEASALGALSTSAITVNANISPDTDVNMVSFTVTAGQVIDFDIDTPVNGTGGLASYIRLFDAQGAQLAFNNDGAAPGENALGFDAYLRYAFTTGGTFYLGVSNSNNVLYDPISGNGDAAGGANAIGSYQLIIQALPIDINDAISEATAIGAISTTPLIVNATIVTDIDVNMVSFTVSAGQAVDFDIDTVLNGPGGLGSYIRLFNAQGQQLSFNNDAVAPGESVVGFDAYLRYTFAVGGTYYLGISNQNNSQYDPLTGNGDAAGGFHSIGNYQLIVQTAAGVVTDPNDAISEASALGAISTTPITVSANISQDTDVNMVGFTVTAGQVVDFDIDTTINGAGGLGSYIRLFNAQGLQLAFNDDGIAPGESTLGFDAYFRYTFASAGTFYLGVSNSNNINYDPVSGNGDLSGGSNTIGSYQLILQAASVVVSDPDDAISEAAVLGAITTTPIAATAGITPDTDVNMVSFTVTSGQVVDFDIDTALNGTGGLGSYLRLFNAQGAQLAFNNDGAAPGENLLGLDAYFRYTFANAGTFYVGVSNSNNTLYDPITGNGDIAGGSNANGTYQLTITALPIDVNDAISEASVIGAVSASPIAVNASLVTDIDVNMIAFSVNAGQTVDFDIDTVLNGPGGLGSFIRLFNAQGQQLSSNNNAAAPGESVIGFDSYLRYTFGTSGTYYLGVSNSNNVQYDPLTGNADTAGGFNSVGSYQLILQSAPAALTDPDDTIAEALQIGSISLTTITVNASIAPDTDVNMVGFSVAAGQVVDFDIDTTANGPGGLGSFLRLFDDQGRQLAVAAAAAASDENVVGYDAYLRFNFVAAGNYYIGVSNANNRQYDSLTGNGDTAGGANAIGSYQLSIQTATIATTDLDDSIPEAISLGSISPTPSSVDFVIAPDTDVDMFSFIVSEGEVVDFDIDTEFNGSNGLNSFLKLFDSQGQLLNSNNDAIAPGESKLGLDAYFRHAFQNAGTYYVAVSNNTNVLYNPSTGNGDVAGGMNATGTYRLVLHSLSTTLDVSINAQSIPEHNGSATGTVFRTNADLSAALVVNLQSSDVGSVSVPASVIIAAGATTANFSIIALDDHIVTGTKLVTITATAAGFSAGTASIKITDSDSLWHNSSNPFDVDGDSDVSPLDVLSIVNYLNLNGAGPVQSTSPPPFLDVDSDNFVSPLDALIVINFLNSQSQGAGEGELVTTAVPIEFIDDFFTNFKKRK